MDIKLETLRYHLVIFWRDFFTIDFYCKSGPFVIQNRYTSFDKRLEHLNQVFINDKQTLTDTVIKDKAIQDCIAKLNKKPNVQRSLTWEPA